MTSKVQFYSAMASYTATHLTDSWQRWTAFLTTASRLYKYGAAPKDVQELLGHSDVSTTMNIYAHATREAKRTSARLLDKVVGTA